MSVKELKYKHQKKEPRTNIQQRKATLTQKTFTKTVSSLISYIVCYFLSKVVSVHHEEFDEEEIHEEVTCVLKDMHGRVYLAECVDVTEGGLILKVEKQFIDQGIFPEEYLDTRFLERELGFKVFVLSDKHNNETLH